MRKAAPSFHPGLGQVKRLIFRRKQHLRRQRGLDAVISFGTEVISPRIPAERVRPKP
jgi:hypothetical protein